MTLLGTTQQRSLEYIPHESNDLIIGSESFDQYPNFVFGIPFKVEFPVHVLNLV